MLNDCLLCICLSHFVCIILYISVHPLLGLLAELFHLHVAVSSQNSSCIVSMASHNHCRTCIFFLLSFGWVVIS